MKKSKVFITAAFLSILLFLFITPIIYTESEHVHIVELDMEHEEQQKFLAQINLSYFTSEQKKDAIRSFSVNSQEMLAIGSAEKSIVSVYDEDGKFHYGYRFNCDGIFGVDWNQNNLIIYFVRGNKAVEVDEFGMTVKIYEIKNEDDFEYENYLFYHQKRSNGKVYSMKNDSTFLNLFTSKNSKLICIDEMGSEKCIYDADAEKGMLNNVMQSIYFTVFVFTIVVGAFILTRYCFKKKEQKNTGNGSAF